MKVTRLHLWITVAIVEAIVIATLISSRIKLVVRQTETPVLVETGPLRLAVEYEVSDKKFDELVKKHVGWIPHRSSNGPPGDWPLLADCAILAKTNYVRILISNGADVEESTRYLDQVGAEE